MIKATKILMKEAKPGMVVRGGKGCPWGTVSHVETEYAPSGSGRIWGYKIHFTNGTYHAMGCAGKVEVQQ